MSVTVVSLFILGSSVLLLVSWLRSACQTILNRPLAWDYSEQVAQAHRLEFLAIGQTLAVSPTVRPDCGEMLFRLERDYEALTYLLRNAATFHVHRHLPGERLLLLNFQCLRWWARLRRFLWGWGCCGSLSEMVAILRYLGNIMGQRLAMRARVSGHFQTVQAAGASKPPALRRWPETARGSRSQDFSSMVRRQGTDGATG